MALIKLKQLKLGKSSESNNKSSNSDRDNNNLDVCWKLKPRKMRIIFVFYTRFLRLSQCSPPVITWGIMRKTNEPKCQITGHLKENHRQNLYHEDYENTKTIFPTTAQSNVGQNTKARE